MYRELDLPDRVKLEEKTGHEPRYMAEIRREHGLERATEEHWKEVKAVYVRVPVRHLTREALG